MCRKIPAAGSDAPVLVDDDLYDSLRRLPLFLLGGRPHVERRDRAGRWLLVPLVRVAVGALPGQVVRLRDRARPLDCRRCNLIVGTRGDSIRAARKRPGTTSRFRGVYLDKVNGRWRASVWAGGRWQNAGRHDDEVAAARARDELAVRLLGDAAVLNFPAKA